MKPTRRSTASAGGSTRAIIRNVSRGVAAGPWNISPRSALSPDGRRQEVGNVCASFGHIYDRHPLLETNSRAKRVPPVCFRTADDRNEQKLCASDPGGQVAGACEKRCLSRIMSSSSLAAFWIVLYQRRAVTTLYGLTIQVDTLSHRPSSLRDRRGRKSWSRA
jgi:hypothetical protein